MGSRVCGKGPHCLCTIPKEEASALWWLYVAQVHRAAVPKPDSRAQPPSASYNHTQFTKDKREGRKEGGGRGEDRMETERETENRNTVV